MLRNPRAGCLVQELSRAIIKDKPKFIDENEREELGPSNKMAAREPSWVARWLEEG